MRNVKIFVENLQLDLFNNETIEVTSSVQNISDIATAFTDFSQAFTVPCSANNNAIFEYYFNNDVDTQIDHNRRRVSRIEIDTVPFRSGKIQLEKSIIKKSNAECYAVTFFGDVVSLKDLVLEDKLQDLDYSALNHDYTGAEIQARIETDSSVTDYDVKYPLISSSRVWQHGDTTSNDISISGGRIAYTELFPAVRVASILDLIETKYSVTFTGNALTNQKFKDAYLYYKNKETYSLYSEPVNIVFGVGNASTDVLYESVVQQRPISNSTLIYAPYDYVTYLKYKITVNIITASSVDYYLDTYKNGVYVSSQLANGSNLFAPVIFGNPNTTVDYTFKIRTSAVMTFTGDVNYVLDYTLNDFAYPFGGGVVPFVTSTTYTEVIGSTTSTIGIDLAKLAPDMKIMDFIKGIFNTLNLTIVPNSNVSFKLQTLTDFYRSGGVKNITQYVITDEIGVARPKLYNAINFEYEQSQSFMNREFYNLFAKEYSNLKAVFGYDGGDYSIKLPFETLLHNKFDGTEIQVGYCLGTSPEYKSYIPKPVLLYQNRYSTVGVGTQFKFWNGSTEVNITSYIPFGQDANVNGTNYSLNFNSDISTFTQEIENNSLYATYYEDYLANLFDAKTRLITLQAILPISILSKIKMNDSIIVRDKKYVINTMTTNLITGLVNFELITNQRDAVDYNQTIYIDDLAQDVLVDYSIPEGYTLTISTPIETQYATPNDYTPVGEQQITFTCTANATSSTRTNTFPLTVVTPDGTLPSQYLTIIQSAPIAFRVVETFGYRMTEDGQKRIIE